MLDIVP